MVQGTPSFELVKMNIFALSRSRRREDLFPVWETFLSKFPDSEVDNKVPSEDLYGEILRRSSEAAR
jgi:hypothetical protein